MSEHTLTHEEMLALSDRFEGSVRGGTDVDWELSEQALDKIRAYRVRAAEAAKFECICDGGEQGEGLVSIPHEPHCPQHRSAYGTRQGDVSAQESV